MSISRTSTTVTSRYRLLAFLVALSLGFAACGADETIDANAGSPPSGESTDQTLPNETTGDDVDPEPTTDANDGFTPLTPRTDLVSLQAITPDEIVVDPADDTRVLVHFQGAAEPCSGAAITVTETDTDVTVGLETGLDPNAAAMTCVAQVFDYEIVIQLDAPLGNRALTSAR